MGVGVGRVARFPPLPAVPAEERRELWSKRTSERLPGAVVDPRGSGVVLRKALSRVITMV